MAFMSMDNPELWTNGPQELKHLYGENGRR
jgi:hypothetical protein